MTAGVWVLVVAAVLVVAWVGTLCAGRVRRLDRLHVRVDAARAALVAALDRRAVAATWAATAGPDPGASAAVLAAVAGRRATAAPGRSVVDREQGENALGRALAALDRAALPSPARVELAEAELVLVLARRVHNDAVRDTLGLRSRRLVRRLHLAGTAPMPAYFEIADPATAALPADVTTAAPGAARNGRGGSPR